MTRKMLKARRALPARMFGLASGLAFGIGLGLTAVTAGAQSGAAGTTGAATTRAATSFPERTVRIAVPATPGGPSDVVARILAEKLGTLWGQSVVVENRPGGQQMIAAALVAKATPDGYTLLQGTSNVATNAIFNRKMPYEPSELVAVSRTHLTPMLLAVNKDVPATSVKELLGWLGKDGATAAFGTTGIGSSQQLATWQLILAAGLPRLNEVAYQGSTQAHPDLIAGRIAMMIDPAAAIAGHVRSGAVRGLAVTTSQRLASLPDVPTLSEAGLASVDLSGWGGLLAPAGTPPAVLAKLNADLQTVLSSPDVQARFEQLGLVAAPTSAEDFQRFVAAEHQRWKKVVDDAGIPVER